MAAWTTQKVSGNWSVPSNNPDSIWYDGGAQTALASVPGSGGTDSVTITATHVVTYDYDMSAAGVLSALVINGTLVASTSAGSYYLKMDGTSGHNITFGASGALQAGSSGTAYPANCTFTIDLNGASGIDCASGPSACLALYCTEPTWNMVRIDAASAGATTLNINAYRKSSDGTLETSKDLTTDATWSAGNNVYVVHVRNGSVDCEARTISSITSNTIVLSSGLTNAKTGNSYVVLSLRNVRIIGYNTNAGAVRNGTGAILNCEIALGSSGYGTSAGTSYVIAAGCIHGGSRGIYSGTGHTIQGSATISGCSNGINTGIGHTIQGSAMISGCSTGVYSGAGHTIQGSATISGCSNGVYQSSVTLRGGTLSNTTDIRGANEIRGWGATLSGTTQAADYRDSQGGQAYSLIWDIGGVAGAVKGWFAGGLVESVATQPTNWPAGVTWVESYRHTFENALGPVFLDKPIYGRADVPITIDVYCQKSASGMTATPRAYLCAPSDALPVPAAAFATATMDDNTDWQKLTLTYTPTYDRELRLRVYAANASGTLLWREVVTIEPNTVPLGGGLRANTIKLGPYLSRPINSNLVSLPVSGVLLDIFQGNPPALYGGTYTTSTDTNGNAVIAFTPGTTKSVWKIRAIYPPGSWDIARPTYVYSVIKNLTDAP